VRVLVRRRDVLFILEVLVDEATNLGLRRDFELFVGEVEPDVLIYLVAFDSELVSSHVLTVNHVMHCQLLSP